MSNHTITLTAEQEACLTIKCARDNANVMAGHNVLVEAAEKASTESDTVAEVITPPEPITIESMLAIKVEQYCVDAERDNVAAEVIAP